MTVALMPEMCEKEGTASVSMNEDVSKTEEGGAGTGRIRPRQGQ